MTFVMSILLFFPPFVNTIQQIFCKHRGNRRRGGAAFIDKCGRIWYSIGMIRKLTAQDRADFVAMSEEFYASPAVEHDIPREFHLNAFDEMMRSDAYLEGYLLLDGDRAAGFALLQKTYSREAGGMCLWIDEIYLRPAFRGKGLAKEFFAFAETLGVPRLRLEVEPENERAESLYLRLGFRHLPYRSMIKGR